MKKQNILLALSLGALLMSTAACGSKDKQQDISEIPAAVSTDTNLQDTQNSLTTESSATSSNDASLGSSSSGRGR